MEKKHCPVPVADDHQVHKIVCVLLKFVINRPRLVEQISFGCLKRFDGGADQNWKDAAVFNHDKFRSRNRDDPGKKYCRENISLNII